jgi:hypothetical protein
MLQRFFSWLFSPFPDTKSTTPYSIDELRDLRVRDLRKIMYGFGVGRGEVKNYLDKEELLKSAYTLLEEERVESLRASFHSKAARFTVIALVITLLYVSKEPVGAIMQQVVNHYLMVKYELKVKKDMVLVALESQVYLAACALVLAMVLDVIYEWIQLGTVASWVVPHDAILIRKILYPFHANLPVNAGMLMGENMRRTEFGQQVGGYGMNMGPMILLAAIRWVKHALQEYGAGCIHGTVFGKAQRKEEKKRRKMEAAAEALAAEKDQEGVRDLGSDTDNDMHHHDHYHSHEGEGGGDGMGYVYSNDNDPGAQAQAHAEAEAHYRAAMAAKEREFEQYLEMRAAVAQAEQQAEDARKQAVEDMLTGSASTSGATATGVATGAGAANRGGAAFAAEGLQQGGWAEGSDDDEDLE